MQVLTMPPDHPESQGSGYGHNSWMSMGGYSQPGQQPTMSPMHDYHGYDYHQAPLPVEPAYSMPRPPPYAAGVPQLPPPLIMPGQNGVWPSMIASQNHGSYSTPILPANPIQTPISAGTGSDATPTSAKTSTSRRKLTDEERRQMCLEAEQNPTMKQTQIGAKFNVERSTVSKILRQKDKYMNPPVKEEVSSPGKKSKAKLPDFEKTLTNWVRNQQKKGLPVTDEDLRKQARVFSFSRSDQALLSSPSWLEMFKNKNSLGSQQKDGGDVAILDSTNTSHADTPLNGSPTSSNGLVSPPMSAMDDTNQRSARDEQNNDYLDFENKDAYSQSPSMHQMINNELDQAILSPLSPEMGRDDTSHLVDVSTSIGNRQRSQTFPHLLDYSNPSRPGSSGNHNPSLPVRSMTTSLEPRPIAVDPRQMMKRHKSVPDIHDTDPVRFSSMQPPPLPKSADMSPVSNPASPTEDDNIKALHAIKKLLQEHPGVAEPDDYLAIGKLMEKLKLLRSPSQASLLPGGLHPMDILDSPRHTKKRTILGIST